MRQKNRKVEYTFTDSQGGYYSINGEDTDSGEQLAFLRARVELGKYLPIDQPLKIRLFKIGNVVK